MASRVSLILGQIAQGEVVRLFAAQHLRQSVAAHRGLDGVLHIGHVDLPARGFRAVHCHIQIGLAGHLKHAQVGNASHAAHHAGDLARQIFQRVQIAAVDLGCQLAFHAAHRLLHVVFNGLREAPDHAGKLLIERVLHGGDQVVFVLVEDWPPLFLRLQAHEVFGIEESGMVGSVVGAARLAGAFGGFRKRAQKDAGLIGDADAFVGADALLERAAHPQRTFVEVRQKLGADDAAEGEKDGEDQARTRRS